MTELIAWLLAAASTTAAGGLAFQLHKKKQQLDQTRQSHEQALQRLQQQMQQLRGQDGLRQALFDAVGLAAQQQEAVTLFAWSKADGTCLLQSGSDPQLLEYCHQLKLEPGQEQTWDCRGRSYRISCCENAAIRVYILQQTTIELQLEQARRQLEERDHLPGLLRPDVFYQRAAQLLQTDAKITVLVVSAQLADARTAVDSGDFERYFLECGRVLSSRGMSARCGSDCFCCLLMDASAEELEALWQDVLQCRKQLALYHSSDRQGLALAASYTGGSLEQLIDCLKIKSREAWDQGIRGLHLVEDPQQDIVMKQRAALMQLLDKKQLRFLLQPIVSSTNAKIYGYELIPESKQVLLPTMEQVLRQAQLWKQESRLEQLVLQQAMQMLASLVESGKLLYNTQVWLKTPQGCAMDELQEQSFLEGCFDYLKNVILELPERQLSQAPIALYKRERFDRWGTRCAVTCTGQQREDLLVSQLLQPELIRADGAMVRGIDKDKKLQESFRQLAQQAKADGASLMAAGICTAGELETVIHLGAQLLQGEYLAKPDQEPPMVSERALEKIGKIQFGKRG